MIEDGHYVQLENKEVWNINPNAWIYTYYWKAGDIISVTKGQDTLFPFCLTNQNSTPSVNGKPASSEVTDTMKTSYSITSITSGGQFVTLSDGSVWQIEPSARYMAQGWSSGQTVFVFHQKEATGQPYRLFNGTTARSVVAYRVSATAENKKINRRPSTTSP